MNALCAEPNDWDQHFQLTADIDLSAYEGTSFRMVGNSYQTPFNGTFDGGGHAIRNLTIAYDSGDAVGLFGALGPAGRIRNLELLNARVRADTYVGALVGYNAGGVIQDCNVAGDVQGIGYTGGIAGISLDNGLICDCRADVNVTGQWYETGGIAGANSHSTIVRCSVAGTVTGSDNTGGVAGRQEGGTISDCSSAATVTGLRWTGGLLGRNRSSDVSACFATGKVSGADVVGGLVGFSDSEVHNCWAAAALRGDAAVGGLVGELIDGSVFHSYSRSVVLGAVAEGGLVGRQRGTCLYVGCFWDSDVDVLPPAVADVVGVSAKSSAELKMESTFTQAGWDFVGETANGTADVLVDSGRAGLSQDWPGSRCPPRLLRSKSEARSSKSETDSNDPNPNASNRRSEGVVLDVERYGRPCFAGVGVPSGNQRFSWPKEMASSIRQSTAGCVRRVASPLTSASAARTSRCLPALASSGSRARPKAARARP